MDTTRKNQAPVAAAVIIDSQRVLLIRRRVPEGALIWQFPAGKVEPGESPEEAAVREAREETGLTVEALNVLGDRIHPANGRQMHYVVCKTLTGTATVASPSELDAVAWCNQAELEARIPSAIFEPVATYLEAALT